MRRTLALGIVVLMLVLGSIAAAPPASSAPTNQTAYALTTTNKILRFRTYAPGTILSSVTVTGLQPGERLLGIDIRPATGELWAVGDADRLYTIDPATGAATERSMLSTSLDGNHFGVDFNPTVDRLRIVSDAEQNLRVNVDTGAVTEDLPLRYTGFLASEDPKVTAVAYTNSQCGPPNPSPAPPMPRTTTLFDLDTRLDLLSTQAPPNDGVLNAVGGLGVNVRARAGFDISGNDGTPYAALDPASPSADATSFLYRIDLTTGDAVRVGRIGTTATPRYVTDIVIAFQGTCPVAPPAA